MRRLWQRLWGGRGPDRAGRARRARCEPAVLGLERRELPVITAFTAAATPNVLAPPDNRYVAVEVAGTITDTRGLPRSANFFVVDEYRKLEPRGPLVLAPTATKDQFAFDVTINLQARRADHITAGRRYYVILTAGDQDGGVGRVVPVLVPHGRKAVPVPQRNQPAPSNNPRRKSVVDRQGTVLTTPPSGVNAFSKLFSGLGNFFNGLTGGPKK